MIDLTDTAACTVGVVSAGLQRVRDRNARLKDEADAKVARRKAARQRQAEAKRAANVEGEAAVAHLAKAVDLAQNAAEALLGLAAQQQEQQQAAAPRAPSERTKKRRKTEDGRAMAGVAEACADTPAMLRALQGLRKGNRQTLEAAGPGAGRAHRALNLLEEVGGEAARACAMHAVHGGHSMQCML